MAVFCRQGCRRETDLCDQSSSRRRSRRTGQKLASITALFDMGGTTAKATIVADGDFLRPETEVGGDAASVSHDAGSGSSSSNDDIAEVGAGGGASPGSILAGYGPQSAGASRPVCYDQGGMNHRHRCLHLGYINPDALVGELSLNRAKSEAAIGDIATRLGQEITDTAYGIH